MKKTGLCTALFTASLLLNAFLLGVFLASPHGPGPHHDHGPRLEQAAQDLDPAYRDKVAAILRDHHAKMDTVMKDMGGNFEQMSAILTAPKFQAEKFKALHASMEKNDVALKDNMMSMMLGIAAVLPDAERIKFFRETAPKDHDFHGGPSPHDDGPGRDDGPGDEK